MVKKLDQEESLDVLVVVDAAVAEVLLDLRPK